MSDPICCKAKRFGWCKNLEVYGNVDDKHYCIFHYPLKETKEVKSAFTEQLELYLNEFAKKDQWCRLLGVYFPPSIEINKILEYTSIKKISFGDSVFTGSASFLGLVLEEVDFTRVQFNESV